MASKSKGKGGRPPVHDPAVIKEEILEWIASGKSLNAYQKQEGKPRYPTIAKWLREDSEFDQRYVRAREDQADALADELMEIADIEPPVDDKGRVDPGWIAWQRSRIDARKWTAAKLKPKKYGDRQQLDHTGDINITAALRLLNGEE